jgi:hypothetical protein
LWTMATAVILTIAAAIALGTAVVMTMIGAAELIALALGTDPAVGWAAIGAVVLLVMFLAAGRGKLGADPRQQALAEAVNEARIRGAGRRLWRSIGKVPALLLSGALGALALGMAKNRRLRRGAMLAFSLLRTFEKASRPQPPIHRPADEGLAAALPGERR